MSGELVLGANGGALLAEYGDAVALATQAADPCCNFSGDIPQRLRIDLWGGRSVCEVYVDEDCEGGTVHYMKYRVERDGPDQQTRYLEVMPDGYGGWHVYVDPDDPERWRAIYTVPAGEQWLARRNYSYHLVRPGCSVELQPNQPYLQYWHSQIALFHNDTLERPGLWMNMWGSGEPHPPSPIIYTPNVDCAPHSDLAVPMPNRTWECLGGEQGVCNLGHYDVNFLNMRLTGEGVWVEPPPGGAVAGEWGEL